MTKNGRAAKDTFEMLINHNYSGRVIFLPKFNLGYHSMDGPDVLRINKVAIDSVNSLYGYVSSYINSKAGREGRYVIPFSTGLATKDPFTEGAASRVKGFLPEIGVFN